VVVPIYSRHVLTISPDSKLTGVSTLEQWTAEVRSGLGLDPGPLSAAETKTVLDLARDVAHAVDRPAAPLTGYLLGLAVGGGLGLPDASDRVRALAARWAESTEPAAEPESGA
jgi:Domain of unknown function (DUF6457)